MIYTFMESTFADEMGDSFEDFVSTGGLMKKMIAVQLNKDESLWWDRIDTDVVETKKDIVSLAFKSISALDVS